MGVFLNQVCGVWLCSLDLKSVKGDWKSRCDSAFLGEVAGALREWRRMWGSGPRGSWWQGGGGREPCPLPLALPTGVLQVWVAEVRSRREQAWHGCCLVQLFGAGSKRDVRSAGWGPGSWYQLA